MSEFKPKSRLIKKRMRNRVQAVRYQEGQLYGLQEGNWIPLGKLRGAQLRQAKATAMATAWLNAQLLELHLSADLQDQCGELFRMFIRDDPYGDFIGGEL